MDVSDFTKDVLCQIAKGVAEAKSESGLRSVGGTSNNRVLSSLGSNLFQDNSGHIYSVIDFDMAVTVTTEGGAGGTVKVPFFEASARGSKTGETVSRVKFSVPICFKP